MSIDVETMKLKRMIGKSSLVPDDELMLGPRAAAGAFCRFPTTSSMAATSPTRSTERPAGPDPGGRRRRPGRCRRRPSDIVDGEAGNDDLLGGIGNDQLIGDIGLDTLNGGSGNDKMLGGDGNDTIDGESGDDWIEGGAGDDTSDRR